MVKVIPYKLARAEAHAFALEMIRQGLDGGGLSGYEDASAMRIEAALGVILMRLEKQASVDWEKLRAYRAEAQP